MWGQPVSCSHRYFELFRFFIRQRVSDDVVGPDSLDARARDRRLRLVEPDERHVADVLPGIVRDDLRARFPFIVADGDEARARTHRGAVQVQLHELYRPSVRIAIQHVLSPYRTPEERQSFGEVEPLHVFRRNRRSDLVVDDERLRFVIDNRPTVGRPFSNQFALANRKMGRPIISRRHDAALAAHRRAQIKVLPIPMDGVVRLDPEDALSLWTVRIAVASGLDDEVTPEPIHVNRQIVRVFVGARMIAGRHHNLGRVREGAWGVGPIFAHEAVLCPDAFDEMSRHDALLPATDRIGELWIVGRVRDDVHRPDRAGRVPENRERPVRFHHVRQLLRHILHVCHAWREDEPVRLGPIEEAGERVVHICLVSRRVLEMDGVTRDAVRDLFL